MLSPGNSFGLDEGGGHSSMITVTSPPQPAVVSTAPQNEYLLNPAECAAGCFQSGASYSTPAYVSGGVARSVTLVYASAMAAPTGVVHLDVTNNSSTPADKISIELRRDGVNVKSEVFYHSGFGTSAIAAEFDATNLETGLYAIEATVRSYWGTTIQSTSVTVKVPVLGRASAVGIGWRILGVQRLVPTTLAAVVIDQGDGSVIRFDSAGTCAPTCTYTSPIEFSRVTRSTASGDSVPWVRHYPDSSRTYFRADGRMSYGIDRAGNRTALTYASAMGQPVVASMTDPLGKVTQFTYEGAGGGWKEGTLRSIVTPGNRASWFGVDQSSDLRQLQDPDGVLAWQMTYDAAHRLTTRLDRRGHSWRYAYDFTGRVAADSLPAIPIDGGALQTPVVRLAAPITRVLVNTASGFGTSLNPAPRVDVSQVTGSITDPGGRATTFTTDRYGLPLRTTDPQGRVTTVTRSGLLATRIDLSTGHWQNYQHSSGRLRYSQAKGERQISYLHGPKGELTEISQTGRPTTRYFTDSLNGRTDSVRIGTGAASKKFTYDAVRRDQVLRVTDGRGHATRLHYDPVWSNVDSVIGDGNRVATTVYDGYGRAIQSRTNSQPTQSTAYDILNRVRATHDGVLPDSTVFEYSGGLLTRVRDPRRQVYQFEFNALGWMTKRFDAADTLLAESFGHNIDGLVTRFTNRRNQLVAYEYDTRGRLRSRTGTGVESAHFRDSLTTITVDSNAIVKTETYHASTGWVDSVVTTLLGPNKRFLTHYVADSLRRLTNVSITNNAGIAFAPRSLAYQSPTGLLVSITVDGQSFGYGYNSGRELTQRNLPAGVSVTITGTAIHRPAEVTYSNPAFQTLRRGYGYASLKRISEVHSRNTSGIVLPTQYYYDNRTQLMAVRADGPTACPTVPDTTFGYGFNCISEAAPTDTAFRYDSVGNRRDRGGSYAAGNRIEVLYGPTGDPSTGYQYEWNADGNIRRKYWRQNPALGDYRYTWTPDG